jgi:hypothetical protein
MQVQPQEARISAMDPPGTREGLGEQVHPPRQCPPATRHNNEFSGSRGNWGPSPGYSQRDPPCSSSNVALAVAVTGEEQQHHNTCVRMRRNVNNDATNNPGTPSGGSDLPSRPRESTSTRGNPRAARARMDRTVSGPNTSHTGVPTPQGGASDSRRHRSPRGCPQDEDHAPAFFNRKRERQ